MKCRNCNIDMNEQRSNKLMNSYYTCSKCLEHRIEFKREFIKDGWLKTYPKECEKLGFVFIPVTEETKVLYFKIIPKEAYQEE